MAEKIPQAHAGNKPDGEEGQDRGCFDFLATKVEKKADDVVMTDSAKEERPTLMDELRRTHSQSSCSSDEERGDGGERKKKKKKKKKGLKDEIMDKLSGKNEGEDGIPNETGTEQQHQEKKGFLEKQHNKADEETPTPTPAAEHSPGCENKEKKGIIDKINEKLPGHHKTNGDEVDN